MRMENKATKEDFEKIGILMRLGKLTFTQLKQLENIAVDMVEFNKNNKNETRS